MSRHDVVFGVGLLWTSNKRSLGHKNVLIEKIEMLCRRETCHIIARRAESNLDPSECRTSVFRPSIDFTTYANLYSRFINDENVER